MPPKTMSSPGSTPSQSDDELIPELAEPGWKTPPARAADQPLDPIPDPNGDQGGATDDELDELGPPITSTTAGGPSSPTSIELPGLEELAATLVGLASILIRIVRTRRRALPDGVWIADEQDQAAIGGPLARIAARHAPAGAGPSGDMVDGLGVLVATTGYAMKGMAYEAEVDQANLQMPDLGAEALA
jgi:hypothetical protein